MTRGYDKNQVSVFEMSYHFVWIPRYRRKILVGDVAQRCEELIRRRCQELGVEILELSVQPDHVHLFVRANPTLSPNKIIMYVKGGTSYELSKEFKHIKSSLPSLWTRSYFVSTHGRISSNTIKKYIENQ